MAGSWDFAAVMDHIRYELIKHQRIILEYGLHQVVLRSPVDSGTYRSNHRVSIGAPDDGYDLGSNTNNAMQAGMAEISRVTVPFTVAYIQNNLAYATSLERGHSQQAPNGIYRLAANDIAERYG